MEEHPDDIRATRYVIYVRKSTDDPQKQVRSIEDQINECKDLAKRLQLTVVGEIISEDISAKKPKRRPKFRAMVDAIERGEINGIIAWHPDRLARNMMEGGELIQLIDDGKLLDLKFVSFPFTNDANGKMMLGISFALSKHYSDKLSADVRRGNMNALKEGKSSGAYKAGYVRNGETGFYHLDPKNFAPMQKAWELRLKGIKEVRIVDEVNSMGYRRVLKAKQARQRREQLMTVQKLNDYMKDPIYYGVLEQADREIDLTELYEFETMVTKEDWEKVQRMRRSHGKVKVKYDFPFRDIVYCAECRQLRTRGASKGKGLKQRKKIYYRCDTKDCSERGKGVRAYVISDTIAELLRSIRPEEIDRDKLQRALSDNVAATHKGVRDQIKTLKTKRTKLANDKAAQALRRVKEDYDDEAKKEYAAEQERLRSQITKLDEQIKTLEATLAFSHVDVERFLNTLKMASEDYGLVPHAVKNDIANMIVLNIYTAKAKVASVKLNPMFEDFIKHPIVLNGGQYWT